jgi:50S ribosomal protein L16 3-hydroxylase
MIDGLSMAESRLFGMSVARFLREHWQKKPLLVRGAMPGFRDPITPDELAGLSCEEGVESRIVREKGGAHPWEVTYGPHPESRFRKLPDRGWTILVQEVNRHVPEAARLLDAFSFLPNVRVDDVMVSFAAPGGSVGPHLDSYDVFLVQGTGERRWRYDTTKTRDVRFRPGLELRILERFTPDADAVLGPGDMLYLPPGFAHHGIAKTPCLTWSIGFRAPSAGEAWKDFAAWSASRDARAATLVEDPPLAPAENPGAIPPALLARVRRAVRAVDTSDDAIDRWFASFATKLAPGHAIEPPDKAPARSAIERRLARGDRVIRSEEGRFAFLERPRHLLFYVAGEEIEARGRAADVARLVCRARVLDGAAIAKASRGDASARALVIRLFAMGALAFE